MSLKDQFRQLVHQMDREDEIAHDLWTWLPSHAAAEAILGDHSHNAQPANADIMQEASYFFMVLRGGKIRKSEAIEWFHIGLDLRCEHAPEMTEDDIEAWIVEHFKSKCNIDMNERWLK